MSSAPVQAASSQLSFSLQGFTAGTYLLRLRIDSEDSIPVVGPPAPGNANQPRRCSSTPTSSWSCHDRAAG